MPISEIQRLARRNHIGASDLPAIMGQDTFKTAADVWLEKRGMLIDKPASEAMKAGNRFEAGLMEYAEEELGPLVRDVEIAVPDLGFPFVAHLDGQLAESKEPVEGKTAGLFGPLQDLWGDEETDQVPERVIIQAHGHMLATDRGVCHIPAFLGGRGFMMYHIPRNSTIEQAVIKGAREFWSCVSDGHQPANALASLDVLKQIRRVPKKVVAVDPALVEKWLKAKDEAGSAKLEAEACQAAILQVMGDAEAGLCGELGALTYYEINRKGFTVEPTLYRTLKHKPKGL